jgi:hypothetical protein
MRSNPVRTLGAILIAIQLSCALPSDPTRTTLARNGTLDVVSAEDSLHAALALAMAEIAARSAQQAVAYDSLKAIWDAANDAEFAGYEGQLICDPLQYAATAKIVGPDGSDIDFGPHKLSIPAGALTTATVIVAEAPTSLVPLTRFAPHGTRFTTGAPVRLDVSYKHCHAGPVRQHRLGFLDDSGAIVEWPPAEDHPSVGMVRGWISHFSAYIVAF